MPKIHQKWDKPQQKSMELSEDTIVEMLRKGKEEGYRFLFKHHYAPLCAIANEYVRDDFVAETIVADVFFHVWQIRQSMEIHTSLRNYLAVSVRRHCIDWIRQQAVKSNTDSSLTSAASNIMDDSEPLAHLLNGELEQVVQEAVDRLPADCQQVFKMSRYEGKKNGEIARELGISVNTVKYHLKNAMKILRSDLAQYLEMFFFIIISQQ